MKTLFRRARVLAAKPQREWDVEVNYLRKILALDHPGARATAEILLNDGSGRTLSYDRRMLHVRMFNITKHDSTFVHLLADADRNLKIRRASAMARLAFDWMEAIFPKRVVSEEVGDALELIDRWRRDQVGKHLYAKIAVKVVSTIIVLSLNSIRFVVSSFAGKKAE